MQRNVKRISSLCGLAAAIVLAGLATISSTGCSQSKTPPAMQGSADQVSQKIQQGAQAMAAYRTAHPISGLGGGQAPSNPAPTQ